MEAFADVSSVTLGLYVLGGPAPLVAVLVLAALFPPNGRRSTARAVAAVACSLLLLVSIRLAVVSWSETSDLQVFLTADPLRLLGGFGALAGVLALAACFWPHRRALRRAGALVLLVTVVGCVWYSAGRQALILDELFWRDGATLVRSTLERAPQRMALLIEHHMAALLLAASTVLTAIPLLAAASLRAWHNGGARAWKTVAVAAVALPLVMLGEATLVHILSLMPVGRCAPMLPVDMAPQIARKWAVLDGQRIVVGFAGIVAAALGIVSAIRLARAGHVAGNRQILAAAAVLIAGGALYLGTRAHAADTAAGPRQAFVGVPFKPFGEVASDWRHPDYITPPAWNPCSPVPQDTSTARTPLVLTRVGGFVASFDDLGQAPRGAAAWEQALVHALDVDEHLGEITGRSRPPRVVEAVIDRAAPLARVRPYLEIAAAHGVDDLIIATRLPDVQSTRTLGEVRVDKLCALATLRIDENLAALDGPGTWEHAVAAYLGE